MHLEMIPDAAGHLLVALGMCSIDLGELALQMSN